MKELKPVTVYHKKSVHWEGIKDDGTIGGEHTPELIFTIVRPRSIITPLELDVTWSLTDDPQTVEEYEMALAIYDSNNVPALGSLRDRAYWTTFKHWRTIGTVGGIFDFSHHENVDFFNPTSFANTELATRRNQFVLALIPMADNVTQHSLKVMATLHWQEVILNRSFTGPDLEEEFEDDFGND